MKSQGARRIALILFYVYTEWAVNGPSRRSLKTPFFQHFRNGKSAIHFQPFISFGSGKTQIEYRTTLPTTHPNLKNQFLLHHQTHSHRSFKNRRFLRRSATLAVASPSPTPNKAIFYRNKEKASQKVKKREWGLVC